jgi:hypothetical protein
MRGNLGKTSLKLLHQLADAMLRAIGQKPQRVQAGRFGQGREDEDDHLLLSYALMRITNLM